MAPSPPFAQSPELMAPQDTFLGVIDLQQRLLPAIAEADEVAWNIGRLLRGAGILELNGCLTEQYPQGLGSTIAPVREYRPEDWPVLEKQAFSCCLCSKFREVLSQSQCEKVVLCGIESHVCVQQTALDLLAEGHRVYVVADAVGSRNPDDRHWSLCRMESSGATIVTTETCLFEWLRTSSDPCFRQISQLVRESPRPE